MILTQKELKEVLKYFPETGDFVWLRDSQRARAGSIAGCICPYHGYRKICIRYTTYKACRLAWLYMTGEWPNSLIDHVDGNRANDSWKNLRAATVKQNAENRSVSIKNTSGVNGVSWQPHRGKWGAHITHNGVSKNLGRFSNLQDAIEARRVAESMLFTHGKLT